MTTRADIVATVRGYLGTPFAHMGRAPGAVLDCAGLIICALRDLNLVAADFDVPPYMPTPDGQSMLALCNAHMDVIAANAIAPGDVVCCITDTHPQHLGVTGDYRHGGLSLIHAANNATPPRVIETRLMWSRALRLVAAFRIRGVA